MARIGYYLFVYPLSKLPLSISYLLSSFFAFVLLHIIRYRRKVILQNIRNSFPQLSINEQQVIASQFYKHFADILIEGIKNLSITKEELTKRLLVKNPELMQELFDAGKNVILVSGHYNNWEWLISSQNFLFPHQAFGIGMPMTNKFWDQKVNAQRQRFGMKVVNAKNYKAAFEAYREKPFAILNLSDQAPPDGDKSYWTTFLNQPTPVLFGTEFMANAYDFSVVFFSIRKLKRGYYEIVLKLITDNPKELKYGEITEAHTKLLEQEIIHNPAFWLWSHKRWKRSIPKNLNELKAEQIKRFNDRFRRFHSEM
jgi:KDO2-lipid IV(A) lauroyltransferase